MHNTGPVDTDQTTCREMVAVRRTTIVVTMGLRPLLTACLALDKQVYPHLALHVTV